MGIGLFWLVDVACVVVGLILTLRARRHRGTITTGRTPVRLVFVGLALIMFAAGSVGWFYGARGIADAQLNWLLLLVPLGLGVITLVASLRQVRGMGSQGLAGRVVLFVSGMFLLCTGLWNAALTVHLLQITCVHQPGICG
jgi:hypothetical protein